MKLNIFRIDGEQLGALKHELKESDYESVSDMENDGHYMTLYLKRKNSKSQGWIVFYKEIMNTDTFEKYSERLGSEMLSGVYIIEIDGCAYAITHGQAHFIVRKYCDKDFGLDLAERIVDPTGLKMKHSQTFSSVGKKDITSYNQKRKVDNSFDYGEAFNYVKCKTIDSEKWGKSADFGESARFTSSKKLNFNASNLFEFVGDINSTLKEEPQIHLPRYKKVSDKALLEDLKNELTKQFLDFITDVAIEDYWITGVSFNFSNEYKYQIKFSRNNLTGLLDDLDAKTVKDVVRENSDTIKDEYNKIKVICYDEDENIVENKKLLELLQITITKDDRYYVLFHNEWVEFSDSYVRFIKEQVDSIEFSLKDSFGLGETDLIEKLVREKKYTQLHKKNIYIGKYCIEQADLMDSENVIMIKDQHNQSDLVYLIRQATTSLRLTESNELGDNNIFEGRNVCLWMLVDRKDLTKLSDFKSFHLLDALNDFKKEVTNKNLKPVVWVSLKKS